MEDLQYVNVLDQNGARHFKNTFSDQDKTISSLSLIFYLDPALWAKKSRASYMAFSGLTPSPLTEIFKNNDYKIRTAYAGNYMAKGKYIDEFLSNEVVKSYCDFALPWYYMQHLGYCSFKINILNKYFAWTKGVGIDFNKQVLDSFVADDQSADPWLSFIYFYTPGHTATDYAQASERHRETYVAQFAKNQKTTAEQIQSLITEISTNDPDGIILFFGDHGPWMSRGLDLNTKNAEFIVQDRHGVLSAIYPKEACLTYMGTTNVDAFTTPSKLMRQLITCLSNGKDPIDWDVDYTGPYKKYRFNNFMYE